MARGEPRARPLPQAFYRRDTVVVARDLLGKRLRMGEVSLRITEVEAYGGPLDTACHARMGRTARNAPMWGPAGRVYVYLCYGLHHMLNIVTEGGSGSAVLVRACEPVEGLEIIRARRGSSSGPDLPAGPGRVGAALALDTSYNHHALYRPGGLEVLDGPAPEQIGAGPRVGIDYASDEDRERPWRFADATSRWVSKPRSGLRIA